MDNESIDPELLKRMMMGEFSSHSISKKKINKSSSKPKKVELDLHFEKIAPRQAHLASDEKLQYQLEALTHFLEECKKESRRSAYVIVGKGEGILKKKVESTLRARGVKHAVVYDPPYFGNAIKLSF